MKHKEYERLKRLAEQYVRLLDAADLKSYTKRVEIYVEIVRHGYTPTDTGELKKF